MDTSRDKHEDVTNEPSDDLIGPAEAARILGVSRPYVYKLGVWQRRYRAYRVGKNGRTGPNWRYSRADVEAFAASPRRPGRPSEIFDPNEPTLSAAQELVARTRKEQGLPPHVEDEAAIRRVANVFTYGGQGE